MQVFYCQFYCDITFFKVEKEREKVNSSLMINHDEENCAF